ncbi:CXXC-type zinc finger protein 1 [Parasteatoda tepidariorum]|uniref:CXXC-type zinc finger protein 1 n=1 Tax=Parasteatoda tepidariorum TaxID=114398 RepID=UPI00077FC6E9|nr:CXXC-type zinc finger protein 1 [Parasteatoda tepidariorum]
MDSSEESSNWMGDSKSDHLHSYSKPPAVRDSDSDGNDDDELVYCICRTKDTNRFMIGCDSCNEWYHGDCISITEEYAKNIKQFFCLMCRERDPSLAIQFKEKKEKSVLKKVDSDIVKNFTVTFDDDIKDKRKNRRCGECVACYRNEDCGRCDYCKDMRKFGGQNKLRQKCRQRQCMNFGHKVGKKPKSIPDFLSDETEDKDPTFNFIEPPPVLQARNSNDEDEDDDRDDDYDPYKRRSSHSNSRHKRRSGRQVEKHKGRKIEHRKKHNEKEKNSSKKDNDTLRQCFGPGCVFPALQNSKYCSDECGLKLATNRIYEILPHRIQQWQRSVSVADENNRKSLEKIRRELQDAKDRLSELNKKQENLERTIEKAKRTSFAADQESLEGETEEAEISIYCVTCGHEVGAKNALKHMEKCFNKYESQTSFGSFYQTNIEGSNIFCDYYNAQQRTYCKRLKILCPEHSKEPKVSDDEVCGCPLTDGKYKEEFCRALKKKCVKHHQWEKFRKAEIDLDRMRVLFKLDDLIEQERNIRQQMANRCSVLGLMLHQTVSHDDLLQL